MNLTKQRGISFIPLVLILALLGFMFTVGIKLFPVYYRGFAAQKIMEDVARDMQGKKPNKKQLWEAIDKRLYIDSISDVKKENFTYTEKKRAIEFGIHYEVRVPLIANIDVVAMFDSQQTINTKTSKN